MSALSNVVDRFSRPSGRWPPRLLALAILVAPLWLFADPLRTYRLHSDDFAYIGASRTLTRALDNLYVPHNTHIVPAWRLLTWAVVAAAGRLANLPMALAAVAYGSLALTMVVLGWLVARETGRQSVGMAAMIALGLTSLMKQPASWYSAGQTLWAGLGILAMLLLLQGWRRSGGPWRLALAALCAAAAGGMWTIGHAAGPVGAVYLWADGRRRARLAAAVPLLATGLAVAAALVLGARQIDATISFHGRTSEEAVNPDMGVSHTLQAIPEQLVLGNLGLVGETTPGQGAILSLAVVLAWAWTHRQAKGGAGPTAPPSDRRSAPPARTITVTALLGAVVGLIVTTVHGGALDWSAVPRWAVLGAAAGIVLSARGAPLERAGMALVLTAYVVEWAFRGYLPYSSLRGIVPWYDTIPLLGAILFAATWWAGSAAAGPVRRPTPLTAGAAVVLVLFLAGMLAVHRPRVDELFSGDVPPPAAAEERLFATPASRYARASYLAAEMAAWQRRHLARMEHAEVVAREQDIGLDGIKSTFGRLRMPEIPRVYDAAPMLDLPADGLQDDPATIRQALGPYLALEPEPTLPAELMPATSPARGD